MLKIRPRYYLGATLLFLFVLVGLEEFVPSWDNNLITDILAVIQAIAMPVIAFIMGRTWDD